MTTKVAVVGIGMGSSGMFTLAARDAIANSDVLIGARRIVQSACDLIGSGVDGAEKAPQCIEAISPKAVVQAIEECAGQASGNVRACVLCSGDTGFFSLAKSMLKVFEEMDPAPQVECIPGITTVQYLAAKIGRPWQSCKLASAHGRKLNVVGQVLLNNDLFLLTGGDETPMTIISKLCDAGLSEVDVVVGSSLSYPNEQIVSGTAGELLGRQFESLSAMWISHDDLADRKTLGYAGFSGIPDELFIRGKVPMTKSEVRAVVTSSIRPHDDEVIYDVGAGTGSVTVELACLNPLAHVIAIESNPEGCELIEKNRREFGAYNVEVVSGRAPEALEGLPAPDAVFIGGSTGGFEPILDAVLSANPSARIVATAVTLETISLATEVLGRFVSEGRLSEYSAVQVCITRTRQAGRYHLMNPESPIFVFRATGVGAGEPECASADGDGAEGKAEGKGDAK